MQTEPYPSPLSRQLRRLAGAAILAALAFLLLWLTAFNLPSAALISAGIGGGAILAATSSDVFSELLEAVLDAIAGAMSALLGLFSFDR